MKQKPVAVAVTILLGFAVAACGSSGQDAGSGPDPDATEAEAGETDATFSISGHAFAVVPPGLPGWGRIEGGTVTVLEMPDVSTETGDEGYFVLDGLPTGEDITLVLEADGFPTTLTKTFTLDDADLDEVAFQVLTLEVTQLAAEVLDVTLSEDKCQLASTATMRGGSLYLPGAHGEEGATVTIDPIDPIDTHADGPIYFNESVIPDRSWEATSADGGVVYVNVEPGDYTLSAEKDGVEFESVELKCRPGTLAVAAPPHALQVLE